ncbi:MAG: TlpA family protein disulfide reductase [Canibacter sp.]
MKRVTRVATVALALVMGATLTACSDSNEGLSQQWNESSDKGFIAGDGSTTSIPEAQRTEPVEFSGTDETGTKITEADTQGDVTVVNFWYAGCAPCRAEAGDLNDTYAAVADQGVNFLGVNTRDQLAQAQQFTEEFNVPYPSILDLPGDRAVQHAFAGQVPLNAVPTTLVLDPEGRVAHRVLGQLASASQLETLITETLAENE